VEAKRFEPSLLRIECHCLSAPTMLTVADAQNRRLVVEFAIPGAPVKDIDYVASPALGWLVKAEKAEAIYKFGLLRIEVPCKDAVEDAVKIAIIGGSGILPFVIARLSSAAGTSAEQVDDLPEKCRDGSYCCTLDEGPCGGLPVQEEELACHLSRWGGRSGNQPPFDRVLQVAQEMEWQPT
jgi:hypothetical protein